MRVFVRLMCVWACVVVGMGATVAAGQAVVAPVITTTPAQNGAVIVSLATQTPKARIYYTLDGSVPTISSSMVYEAPFLVASNVTVKAFAHSYGRASSSVTTRVFAPKIASGALAWSDEFANSGSVPGQPDPATWTYDVGTNCCGNHELETYCAWGSTKGPCSTSAPNAFVGADGYLHVVGMNPAKDVYTSARLKSAGLFSFMYGRVEARMKLPESQGMWPAFWLLGSNIATVDWPACGELDVMEHINGNNSPYSVREKAPGYDWIAGSVHGGTSGKNELNGTEKYHPAGFSAAEWHTYGMTWTKGKVEFYVDDPAKPYATFTPTNGEFTPETWPFDAGPQFLILNLAIGGDWPGNPDAATVFPGEMLVDYVHIYAD